jgi:hypothetical protein
VAYSKATVMKAISNKFVSQVISVACREAVALGNRIFNKGKVVFY